MGYSALINRNIYRIGSEEGETGVSWTVSEVTQGQCPVRFRKLSQRRPKESSVERRLLSKRHRSNTAYCLRVKWRENRGQRRERKLPLVDRIRDAFLSRDNRVFAR
jgi:hypothetical protein